MKKAIIIFFMSLTIFSVSAEGLKGKDIVRKGEIINIEGELKYIDSELYIETKDVTYQIHLGPEEYAIQIDFSKNVSGIAQINAYVSGNDLAPISLTYNKKVFRFWDVNGKPLWSGKSYSGGSEHNDH